MVRLFLSRNDKEQEHEKQCVKKGEVDLTKPRSQQQFIKVLS
jgi:hypothetical protein